MKSVIAILFVIVNCFAPKFRSACQPLPQWYDSRAAESSLPFNFLYSGREASPRAKAATRSRPDRQSRSRQRREK